MTTIADCCGLFYAHRPAETPLNVPLFLAVLRRIRVEAAKPELRSQWDQKRYIAHSEVCGTTACFAGWTVLLSGWTTDEAKASVSSVSTEARRLLGLTDAERTHLFLHTNTVLAEIEACAAEIFTSRGLDLSLLTSPHPAELELAAGPTR